jgi:hypothetical protein
MTREVTVSYHPQLNWPLAGSPRPTGWSSHRPAARRPGRNLDHLAAQADRVEPGKLQATGAAIVKVLSTAQIEYAARRVRRR